MYQLKQNDETQVYQLELNYEMHAYQLKQNVEMQAYQPKQILESKETNRNKLWNPNVTTETKSRISKHSPPSLADSQKLLTKLQSKRKPKKKKKI